MSRIVPPPSDPVRVARASRNRDILAALRAGFTVRQVGRAFGVSPAWVWCIGQRYAKKGDPPALTN